MTKELNTITTPPVSVIIVSFNSCEDVLACLSSLRDDMQSGLIEVIVVDNGSNDGTPAQISSQFPSVKLHALRENHGFAHACNVGIRDTRSSDILLLNPDTMVQAGAISCLRNALLTHPHWGIVGPQMLDQTRQIYSAARRFPSVWRLVCETLALNLIFPRTRLFNSYLYGDHDHAELDKVDQVEGSALMISSEARARTGELDEQFFIFFEEVDWCRRVMEQGFEIHVAPEAKVLHRRSTTMSKFFIFSRQMRAQSAMKYFLKHHGAAGLLRLRVAMSFAQPLRLLLLLPLCLTGKTSHRKRMAATLAEWIEFMRGIHA